MSQETTNTAWLDLIRSTIDNGSRVDVRGSTIIELENASITVDPMWPFITYKARKYNVPYCKKELLWKIDADRYNTDIEKYAKMWESVKNDDGSFNSNYGYYWFYKQGIHRAIEQLCNDKYTRRASIPMLAAEHVDLDVRDTVCTEAMTFLIRDDKLNCHVHMRSSDQIYGLGTDIPSFSFVQRLILGFISHLYPEVEMGSLTIVAASSHIYERHFEMVKALVNSKNPETFEMRNDFWMPIPDHEEAVFLMNRAHLKIYRSDKTRVDNPALMTWLLSSGEL